MSGIFCNPMRLTAGFGSVGDMERLIAAGADELFCGYVPVSWRERYGNAFPLNRREVFFYHVQIGTLEDMKRVRAIADRHGIPVSVTMNSLYYTPEQLPILAGYIRDLYEIGFDRFIVADLNLIRYLHEQNVPCCLHVSGEFGELNTGSIRLLASFRSERCRITRLIFHRKNSPEAMRHCIEYCRRQGLTYEWEAFFMNENCHYTGAFCNSLHCDELEHICRLPYRVVPLNGALPGEETERDRTEEQIGERTEDRTDERTEDRTEERTVNRTEERDDRTEEMSEKPYCPGESGCGICALEDLAEAGIGYLKIVGRGASADCMEQDIRTAKAALRWFGEEDRKERLFPNGCSGNCYYR